MSLQTSAVWRIWFSIALTLINQSACVPENSQKNVRLVRGHSPLEGAVEVQYGNRWLPVCHDQWGIFGARAVCRQLGFPHALNSTGLHRKDTMGGSARLQLRLDFSCHGLEEYLTQCQSSGPSTGRCRMVAGVICSNQTSPNAGKIIRLSPEEGSSSGLVEVDYLGEWWSICSEGWSTTAAQVACRQLGYQYANPVNTNDESRSLPSKLLSSFSCKGTEQTLEECGHQVAIINKCNSDQLATVDCGDTKTTALPDFQVRLAGGYFPYEGRVEISFNGKWGTVCDDSWGYIDADVVCQQLGYYAADSVESQAYFGEGSGPIFLDDVGCLGNETSLINCSHMGIGVHNCKHSEDAGVRCHEFKVSFPTLPPDTQDSILPLIVILINGVIVLFIVISCLIYCSLKMWDRRIIRLHSAFMNSPSLGQAQGGCAMGDSAPMEYLDSPPEYHTVHENQDVYITQRSETPPPDYNEAMKLQMDTNV